MPYLIPCIDIEIIHNQFPFTPSIYNSAIDQRRMNALPNALLISPCNFHHVVVHLCNGNELGYSCIATRRALKVVKQSTEGSCVSVVVEGWEEKQT